MSHPVDEYVGKRIRQRSWMIGLTQQQLGNAVGIKFQQIQKYETGMNRVSASRLWDISVAMDVPVTFFYDGYEGASLTINTTQAKTGGKGDFLSDKEALDLVRSYYAIPENQRRKLFDLARVLSEAA